MMFTTVYESGRNFTPASLMKEYADHTKPYYRFFRGNYSEAFLECDGFIFAFDHWLIEKIGDYERIYVYLKVIGEEEK